MYREVTMIEFKEVLDPKTVRRYLWAAEAAGLRAHVLLALQPGVVPTARAGPAAVNKGRRSCAG